MIQKPKTVTKMHLRLADRPGGPSPLPSAGLPKADPLPNRFLKMRATCPRCKVRSDYTEFVNIKAGGYDPAPSFVAGKCPRCHKQALFPMAADSEANV